MNSEMNSDDFEDGIANTVRILKQSQYAVVFSGAGISTPSGIPDFRSAETGLWTKNDPMAVASLTAFRYRPETFYNWLRPLIDQSIKAKPNPAHIALTKMEKAGIIKAIITQNIDGLHKKAGALNLLEIHGSMDTLKCLNCGKTYLSESYIASLVNDHILPKCTTCNAILKPDIVLYEEMLPEKTWEEAQNHCINADTILVIGSSLNTTPANRLPVLALENNAELIINTMSKTYLDNQATVLLPYDVTKTIPKIINALL